jgi:thioredoxin 1
MKRTSHIGDTAVSNAHECTWISAVILLTALAAGGCSSAVGPHPGDGAKPAASGDATTTVSPRTDGETAGTAATKSPSEKVAKGLPRLLDLGAGQCIPCKMMAPILEELKTEYAGVFDVEFIDVWRQPDRAERYGVETIPTQIFFDASGKEVFRHVGFFSKEEILAKWKEIGVERTEPKEQKDV